MKKIFLTLLSCLILFVTLAGAAEEKYFDIQVGNTTAHGIYYYIYWIDHDQKDVFGGPVLIVASELDFGKIDGITETYRGGEYKFVWGYTNKDARYSKDVRVTKDIKTVLFHVHDTRPGEVRIDFLKRKG